MDAIETIVDLPIEEADRRIRVALGEQGFGVLTEIDVAATLKARIDVDRPPLVILGACNPHLAHRALEIDPTVSLMLPCNVVLAQTDDGRTRISAVDPRALMDDPAFSDLAEEAAAKLGAAVSSVA